MVEQRVKPSVRGGPDRKGRQAAAGTATSPAGASDVCVTSAAEATGAPLVGGGGGASVGLPARTLQRAAHGKRRRIRGNWRHCQHRGNVKATVKTIKRIKRS